MTSAQHWQQWNTSCQFPTGPAHPLLETLGSQSRWLCGLQRAALLWPLPGHAELGCWIESDRRRAGKNGVASYSVLPNLKWLALHAAKKPSRTQAAAADQNLLAPDVGVNQRALAKTVKGSRLSVDGELIVDLVELHEYTLSSWQWRSECDVTEWLAHWNDFLVEALRGDWGYNSMNSTGYRNLSFIHPL